MGDYRDVLLDEISNLKEIVVILNVNFDEKYLIPFKKLNGIKNLIQFGGKPIIK